MRLAKRIIVAVLLWGCVGGVTLSSSVYAGDQGPCCGGNGGQ